MTAINLPITDDLIEALSDVVYARVLERLPIATGASPWLTVAEVASYLRCQPDRIYTLRSAGRIPFHKDGSRLLFHRSEIDDWVRSGGGIRP